MVSKETEGRKGLRLMRLQSISERDLFELLKRLPKRTGSACTTRDPDTCPKGCQVATYRQDPRAEQMSQNQNLTIVLVQQLLRYFGLVYQIVDDKLLL